ncbi:DUF1826 domain-containing protein [Halomonas saccharevitans]|uniref:DUF1826 domain-containing protein n=1 Tax=Halomonas saccharevitans TaxID=416872 RepID=A0A1I6XDX7_9GAMM|nr:DUF1826 domain-containing protein [Halomonas saccharevitans]SFT36508.1 Protein of unknown function [Halomonas saccharevitans]
MPTSARRQDSSDSRAIPRHAEGKEISTLPRIFEDDINIAIMRRRLPDDIQAGVKTQLQAERALSFAWLGPAGDALRAELAQHLHAPDACGELIEDIVTLADAMAYLFDTDTVGLRLRRMDGAMCPRFHCDNLPVRLVTTYHGPGSEWLPEWAVNRHGLGAPTPEKPEIVTEPGAVQRLEVGDLALLKGSGWIGNEAHGLVHRSPDVPAGQPRLLLTLDPA